MFLKILTTTLFDNILAIHGNRIERYIQMAYNGPKSIELKCRLDTHLAGTDRSFPIVYACLNFVSATIDSVVRAYFPFHIILSAPAALGYDPFAGVINSSTLQLCTDGTPYGPIYSRRRIITLPYV